MTARLLAITFILASTIGTVRANAQIMIPGPYHRLLLPIYSTLVPIRGAYGSVWTTELAAINNGTQPVNIGPCGEGFPVNASNPPCLDVPVTLPPLKTVTNFFLHTTSGHDGRLIYVLDRDAAAVRWTLRLFEGGRFVAELPVVPESEFARTVEFLSVDVTADSRTTVRVCGLDNRPSTVRVTGYLFTANFERIDVAPLGTSTVSLTPTTELAPPTGLPFASSYAALSLDDVLRSWNITRLLRVRIVFENISDDQPIWAFASITDTRRNSVALVTPPHPTIP